MSSEGIRFCAKFAGIEMNNHIELEEELQPAGLPPSQVFGSGEILKVLVVCNNVNQFSQAFRVVVP